MAFVPAEPLVSYIDARGGMSKLMDAKKINQQPYREKLNGRYLHAKRRGQFTVRTADEICVDVLGLMPQDIYGEAWWAA